MKAVNSLDEIDPELRRTFEKLGISLDEQKRLSGVAVDAVIDSVSIGTSFKKQLGELGIIFCSMSEAIQEHPELIKKHLSSVVPITGQLLFCFERRCIQRWFILLYTKRCSLPDGAVNLFQN
jgi:Fe-S cluster assembly scaffold protein SufB